MITENKVLLSRYAVERKIGQGGFAQVYLATDQLLKRRVAVKVLNPDLVETEGFLARFEQEAQAVAAFEHPNILSVYDYSKDENTACLVTPYVEGGTVYDKLYREGKFSLQTAGAYLTQVAAALDYAHRRNVVHRDIKPQNMLLRAEDDRLLLGDFGIAKVLGTGNAQTRTSAIGTIYYMAPEQLQGNVGVGTDIYALGCVLFQMLTGELPYTGTTEQVMRGHLLDQVPSITTRSQGQVPPTVQEVINRALAKRPEDRYQSAGEMAQAFANVISRPVYSTPPTSFDPHRAYTQVVMPPRVPTGPNPPAPVYNPVVAPVYNPAPRPVVSPYQPGYQPRPYPAPQPVRKSNSGAIAIVGIVLAVVIGAIIAAALAAKPGPTPNPTARPGVNTPQPTRPPVNTPQPTSGTTQAGFARLNSSAGRFSVIMPVNPVAKSQQTNTPFGVVNLNTYQAQLGTQASYLVAYNDYPPGVTESFDQQEFLHSVLTGQESSAGAISVGDEQTADLHGVPGRQTSYRTTQNGVTYVHLSRAYLDGDRLYQMLMIYPANNKPEDNLVDIFFGSFTILN